jgi:hypothetical protein
MKRSSCRGRRRDDQVGPQPNQLFRQDPHPINISCRPANVQSNVAPFSIAQSLPLGAKVLRIVVRRPDAREKFSGTAEIAYEAAPYGYPNEIANFENRLPEVIAPGFRIRSPSWAAAAAFRTSVQALSRDFDAANVVDSIGCFGVAVGARNFLIPDVRHCHTPAGYHFGHDALNHKRLRTASVGAPKAQPFLAWNCILHLDRHQACRIPVAGNRRQPL